MIQILGIAMIAGIKALLTKGISLGIFLLLFFVKGKQLKFNSDRWDDFFLDLSPQKVQKYAVAIYLSAACISSAVSYFVFVQTGYRHSFGLSALFFAGGLMISGYRWKTKGKDYLLKRYQEIPSLILARHEKETTDK